VRVADSSDEAAVLSLLCAAFRDDPLTVAVVPNRTLRRAVTRFLFTDIVAACLASRRVVIAADEDTVAGAAVWSPLHSGGDGARPRGPVPAEIAEIAEQLRVPAQLARRALGACAAPSAYLWLLGVDPSARGGGLGASLVRHVAARAQAEGFASLTLHTEHPRNRGYYLGLGFAEQATLEPPLVPTPIWCFARSLGGEG
jgi:GNAT superfamily N-acetyltransferase